MFTNLQLRSVQATDARNEYDFRDYVALRSVASGVALGVIAAVALLAGYAAEAALVILIVGAAKCVESFSNVIYGLLQKHERLDLIATSMIIRGPLSLAAVGVLLYVTRDLAYAVLGLLAAWVFVLLVYDARNARRFSGVAQTRASRTATGSRGVSASAAVLPRLAWLSLPLGVVALLDSLNFNLPRYLIERHLGEAALGYFAAMAYVMVAGYMVAGALAQSAMPRLARSYVRDLAAFRRLAWSLARFGIALGAAGVILSVLFGRQILTVLYRPDYAAFADVFVWLTVGTGLGCLAKLLVCSMTAARQFKAQAPLYGIALLATGGMSSWLIPQYGLLGGAWAVCAGTGVLVVGSAGVNVWAVRIAEGRRWSRPREGTGMAASQRRSGLT
jgi:O-antigen/teichoic acid export membrane protein